MTVNDARAEAAAQKMRVVNVKHGRDWHVRRGHPWLFSGAIQSASARIEAGELVRLHDAAGEPIGIGYYNPQTDIAVRMLTLDAGAEIDPGFIERRLAAAIALRQAAVDLSQTDVYRLVNGEGDFLPGFIVDRFAAVIVVQSHTAGADRLLPLLLSSIEKRLAPEGIVVRKDVRVRQREGLAMEDPELACGRLELPVTVIENGLRFLVDPLSGQKTGFFTDQRDKRLALAGYASRLGRPARLLNCFSYSGSFAVYAAARNADLRTVNVDESAPALAQARRNFELNGLDPALHDFVEADAFDWLRKQRDKNAVFDLVVVDPPAFAKSNREKEKALKGYARLNELALALVQTGGLLVTCSCSGAVRLDEFESCLREAAGSAGRSVQVLETYQHGADHPVSVFTPELNYLKAMFCRVDA